ncbi:hypothetical protein ACOSQ2_001714 [Xanthoceras sorbifolium]
MPVVIGCFYEFNGKPIGSRLASTESETEVRGCTDLVFYVQISGHFYTVHVLFVVQIGQKKLSEAVLTLELHNTPLETRHLFLNSLRLLNYFYVVIKFSHALGGCRNRNMRMSQIG